MSSWSGQDTWHWRALGPGPCGGLTRCSRVVNDAHEAVATLSCRFRRLLNSDNHSDLTTTILAGP